MSIDPSEQKKKIPANGAVLVVEDDDCLRTVVNTMFLMHGQKVYTASDGEEGEQLFLSHQNEILLVLVDLGLPKIEGVELIRRFRRLKPEIRIIVTSGYNDKPFIDEILREGGDAFLRKPYNQADFQELVRQYLP